MKSKLAITSFILGIISLLPIFVFILQVGSKIQFSIIGLSFFSILTAPVGLIFGIIPFFIIKRNNLKGMWMSILGTLFSILGLIMLGFIIAGLGVAMTSFL